MQGKPKKGPREKDLTSRYLSGGLDEDRVEPNQRFTARNKSSQHDKMLRTALLRADEESDADVDALPIGEIIQVFSLFCEVEYAGTVFRCVMRRTLTKISDAYVIVGDRVRFRDVTTRDEAGKVSGGEPDAPPAGVIEQVMPRRTILTRADSFKGKSEHPIVANADQMLVVASLRQPKIKWGLIDRMVIAAKAGGLKPIICLNKIDLAEPDEGTIDDPADMKLAKEVLAHYESLGVDTLRTSVTREIGLTGLGEALRGKTTVLSGHSGVGKSSLIRAVDPKLQLRIGEISAYTDKGRHTTTSARRYLLSLGGTVIDTPGVKIFGLWGVTQDNLEQFFPDVVAGTAPAWRQESFQRIADSLNAVQSDHARG